jgi:hypothetical protein
MRLLLTFISIIFLLLAIASFVTTCAYLLPTIEFLYPKLGLGLGWGTVKKAIGTVSDVHTSSSSSRSLRDGQSYTTGSTTVTIQFHDEKGHLFDFSCHPIFKNFKEKSSVNVIYYSNKDFENTADLEIKDALAKGKDILSTRVPGIPVSIFLWLERPVIFFILGIVLLILRIPIGQFKNIYP